MYKISIRSFEFAKKYIAAASSIYFVNILTGAAEGIVWADEEQNPRLLIIWSDYQKGFQLMGKALEKDKWGDFYKWYEEIIEPFLKSKQIEEFECGVDSQELAEMLEGVFRENNIKCEKQKIFYHTGKRVNVKEPHGYCYEKIDSTFLHKAYDNMTYIIDEIELAYGSCENYLEKGYGYAAIKNNEIVARAIMSFSFQDKNNISVNTLESHRRKGLSSYLVSKVVEETLNLNHLPIWDCNEYNKASEKTAEKCGFKLVREDKVYWFCMK